MVEWDSYQNAYSPASESPVDDSDHYYFQYDPEAQSADNRRWAHFHFPPSPSLSLSASEPYHSGIKPFDDFDSSETHTSNVHDAASLTTRHYGPPPGQAIRRRRTKRRVKLTNGHFVLNHDIPDRITLPHRKCPETRQMRYTAVTCDPDHFESEGYFLRQNEYNRGTELFIVITMYNEDEILFCRTLYGVMQNIAHLCSRNNSQTWGPNAWQNVVVCIVADGRKQIHPRVLDCLTLLGVYQEGAMKQSIKKVVDGQEQTIPVVAHLFEYTTTFALDSHLHLKYPHEGIVPTQIIFCLKEKNQKKINSHRWFWNAFSPLLQPNICILLDVGTRPGSDSLYRLWKAFDLHSNVGGACGEISAYKGKHWSLLLNPLVAAQNFEYKMSGILDKTTESVFGYINVLPGAFSAYRYIALQNDENGVGPLASYFKGETLYGRGADVFTSNMYLAEDRVLCFELIAKPHSNWVLRYVKGAYGETDVPDNLAEFISQRRRWLNGSFFAAIFAIAHTRQILSSGHSVTRKLILLLQTIYNAMNLVFSWFSLGNCYLFFIILTSSLEETSLHITGIKYLNLICQIAMAGVIIACFLFSMGNKPKASPGKYKMATLVLALLTVYLLAASVVCAIQAVRQGGSGNTIMLFSVIITYGVYLGSSIIALDAWHMLTSFIPFLLLTPTYVNLLNIYAFSNLDDISWGTKEDHNAEVELDSVLLINRSEVDVETYDSVEARGFYEEALLNIKLRRPIRTPHLPSASAKEQAAKAYYANVRTNVLLAWVFSNFLLVLAILEGARKTNAFTDNEDRKKNPATIYLTFILAFTAITNIIRFTGAFLYSCTYLLFG